MSNPRYLRVLLIHDNPDLGDDALTVLRSPRYSLVAHDMGMQRRYLASWHEVVQSLRAILSGHEQASVGAIDRMPLPDLLIIDCNFEEDKQAPGLAMDDFGTMARHVDPRGLLYGVVWAAFMAGKSNVHPFAFMLYSQAVDQIKHDGLGLTFFGLLLAIAEPDAEATAARNSQGDEVERLQEALPRYVQQSNILHVLEKATQLYRSRILRMSEDDLVSIEPASVEDCLCAVEAFCEGSAEPPDDLGLRWRSHNQQDHVQLASLATDAMSDHSNWDRSRCSNLIEWLRILRDETNWKTQKWKALIESRDNYGGEKRAEIFRHLSKTPSERDGFRILSLVMVWCELQCCVSAGLVRGVHAQDILGVLGMETHQAQRPLRRFFGDRMKLGPFLDSLAGKTTWPYGSLSWIVPATQSYLRELGTSSSEVTPWITKMKRNVTSIPKTAFARKNWPALVAD